VKGVRRHFRGSALNANIYSAYSLLLTRFLQHFLIASVTAVTEGGLGCGATLMCS